MASTLLIPSAILVRSEGARFVATQTVAPPTSAGPVTNPGSKGFKAPQILPLISSPRNPGKGFEEGVELLEGLSGSCLLPDVNGGPKVRRVRSKSEASDTVSITIMKTTIPRTHGASSAL